MAFLSGSVAYVKTGATPYKFSSWKATLKSLLGKTTNFTVAASDYIGGIVDAKITLEGPYDNTGMGFTAGSTYTLLLGFTSTGPVQLSIPCICETIEPSIDVEKEQRVTLTFQSAGIFTAAIV